MLLVFAAMSLALSAVLYGRYRFAAVCAIVCLALSTGLFLFEIHSAQDGFRMPWLQG